MNKPTITKTEAVTAEVTTPNIGDKNNAKKNINAVDTAVNPVLPPSATPDALSTKVLTVLVPRHAPTVVPTASAKSAFLILGTFPSVKSREEGFFYGYSQNRFWKSKIMYRSG